MPMTDTRDWWFRLLEPDHYRAARIQDVVVDHFDPVSRTVRPVVLILLSPKERRWKR